MLSSGDSYILELYDVVYVWQGKNSSIEEKRAGITLANKYKEEWKKPKDKGLDLTTTAKQDISKIANQHQKAAKLLLDKLGQDFKVTVYHL